MSRIQIIIDSIAGVVGAVLGFMYGEVNGLFRALIAFMILDYVSGVPVAMTAVMLFYIANEGISIVENASALGLPVPQKIKNVLRQIKSKSGEDDSENKGH